LAQLSSFAARQIKHITNQLPQVLRTCVDSLHVVQHYVGELRFAALLSQYHIA
jgi:hypothetical protein